VTYHLMFDASQNGSQLAVWFLVPLFPLIFLLIGWGLKGADDPQMVSKGKFFMLLSTLGFAFSIVLAVGNGAQYMLLKRALTRHDYHVIEGTVSDFVPMPRGGHATESFRIGTESFHYGSGWGSIVFNSEWNRGYIHNGAQVRLAYRGDDILRIEVLE
jgi:hypothetical protein